MLDRKPTMLSTMIVKSFIITGILLGQMQRCIAKNLVAHDRLQNAYAAAPHGLPNHCWPVGNDLQGYIMI